MNLTEAVKHHPLFSGLTKSEIETILSCFHFKAKEYTKNEYILMEGDHVVNIGVILHGTVLMEKNDQFGNNYFFTELREHEIFGEPFMGQSVQNTTVNYKAMTGCRILIFPYQEIWKPCQHNCSCHHVFTQNLMNLLAAKTRTLLTKIEILSKKSLRDRILTFFTIARDHQDIIQNHTAYSFSGTLQNNQLILNLNRTELAEYLGVNRSALVRELGRMQAEGIIAVSKNIYTILP